MPRQKMSPETRRNRVVYLDEDTARRLRVMAAGLGCPAGEAVARMLCLAERVVVVPVRALAPAGADPEVAP